VAKLENDLARMNQAPPAPVRPNHVSLFWYTLFKQEFSKRRL
jgi:hypothetical protein